MMKTGKRVGKKLGALALSAVISASMLSGCGGSGDGGDTSGANSGASSGASSGGTTSVQEMTLKVWVPEGEMDITKQLCDQFNEEHSEFDITYDIAVTGIDEAADGLTNDAETAADVFQLPSGSLSQLVDAGLLLPITKDIDTIKGQFSDSAIDACSRGNEMYGIPFSPNTWFLFYNKSLVSEEDLTSLDTLMAKDLGKGVKNFSCQIHNSWYVEAFFYGAGCTLFGENGTDPTSCDWNNEKGVAAGEYLIDLAANPKYVEDNDGVGGSMFKNGEVAVCSTGAWSLQEFTEALGDNLGAVMLPKASFGGVEGQLSNFADFKTFAVKSNTTQPLAAQLLAEYLANEGSQLLRYQTTGDVPAMTSLASNPEIAENEAAVALIKQAEAATPQPYISQINEYWTPAESLGTGIVNGEITKANLQKNLDSMVKDITTKLSD